jgi:nucleoside 2-deoxyribosyltransferase
VNIYFSCSITGGRQDQRIYQSIVKSLEKGGHSVPTAHLSNADVMSKEVVIQPRAVYERDVRWVNECDALIAEVSTPSHGVGYEIALALFLKKPVLCCYQQGRRVSKMITGNDSPTLCLYSYHDLNDLLPVIEDFLHSIK